MKAPIQSLVPRAVITTLILERIAMMEILFQEMDVQQIVYMKVQVLVAMDSYHMESSVMMVGLHLKMVVVQYVKMKDLMHVQ